MGICYLSRRTPYDIEYAEQMCVYPIGTNGMPEGDIIIPKQTTILSKYICSENPQVTGIYLPDSIKNFEDDCFKNCPNITRVDCPDGIEIIPIQCFQNCASLEKVTLPKSLSKICERAFNNCSVLKDITFRSKERKNPIYHAYKEAFANCPSLTDEDVNNIAEYMDPNGEKIFANNPQLVEVEVYRLGDEMFDMSGVSGKVRSRLKKVTVKNPNSQGVISANLPFNDCYSLETVVLPEGTLAIGDQVLFTTDTSSENSCIMHVNIPSTCKSIGSKTFYHSPNLQELFIPKSITYIGRQAFERSNLSALEVENGTNCKIDSLAFKSSKINNESVNTLCLQPIIFDKDSNNNPIITEQQFAQCNNLTDIVTSRSYIAMFERCEFLKTAVINDQGLNTTLYAKMFKNCISLTDVTINDADIITFGESMFEGCSSLKNVSWLPSTKPKEYGKRMFAASGLEKIRLQDNALSVSEEMFKDCRALKHIYIPDNITEYKANCFNNCGDFKGSVLEDGDTDERLIVSSRIRKIGSNAFERCGQLEKVVFPKVTMDSLGDYVFKDCIHLKEVQMPTKVNACGAYIFQGCISLQHINPVAIYNYGDSYFADLPNLEEIVIPNGVTKLDLNLFARCTNLKKVTLPASINSWGVLRQYSSSGTYYYSNIDAVIDRVYYNGQDTRNKNLYIFLNCPNITDVVLASGWNQTFDLHSLNLTFDSITQILINIADVSSYKNKPTLTLGASNLAKIPKTENDIYEKDEEGNIKVDEDGNQIEIPGFRAAYNAYNTAKNTKKWNIA